MLLDAHIASTQQRVLASQQEMARLRVPEDGDHGFRCNVINYSGKS
jgi:hypothetical protein